MRQRILIAVAVVLVSATVVAAFVSLRSRASIAYITVPVTRGQLTQSVTASGTVNAQNTVNVGTQVSGTIQRIYVDYNSQVHTGQVLAQIDASQYQAQFEQARAILAQTRAQAAAAQGSALSAGFSVPAADASIASARAATAKAQAALVLARQTLQRDRTLLARGFVAQSQFDADYASAIAAETSLQSAQALTSQNVAQRSASAFSASASSNSASAAAAAILSAQATVEQDALNVARTTISSPVDGTIVARNVSVGQTVAASFQTPTLFTIAQDLKKMEVDIAVGEPDIGNVRPGQPVAFSVLAFPNETFHGIVSQVRVNPTTIANVVTYTVVVLVANGERKLLPGMTANCAITMAVAKRSLIVPVQALTYRPSGAGAAGRATVNASPWGATSSDVSGAIVPGVKRSVYVLRDDELRLIPVRVDLIGGPRAAITALGALSGNDRIVIGDSAAQSQVQRSTPNPAFGGGRMIR